MQEEWYEPSPRDKRRAEAFFATPEGKKERERYRKLIYSVSPKSSSSADSDYGKDQAKHPSK